MADLAPFTHLTFAIEDAHLVRLRCPINSHKPLSRQHVCAPCLVVDVPCDSLTPVLALDGATPHWRDRTDNLAGAQIRPRRSSAGHPGTPGEAADLVIHRSHGPRGQAVEAAGAVDAKNASTSSLGKRKNAFPTATTAFIHFRP